MDSLCTSILREAYKPCDPEDGQKLLDVHHVCSHYQLPPSPTTLQIIRTLELPRFVARPGPIR